jgi:hypothetical protein
MMLQTVRKGIGEVQLRREKSANHEKLESHNANNRKGSTWIPQTSHSTKGGIKTGSHPKLSGCNIWRRNPGIKSLHQTLPKSWNADYVLQSFC